MSRAKTPRRRRLDTRGLRAATGAVGAAGAGARAAGAAAGAGAGPGAGADAGASGAGAPDVVSSFAGVSPAFKFSCGQLVLSVGTTCRREPLLSRLRNMVAFPFAPGTSARKN